MSPYRMYYPAVLRRVKQSVRVSANPYGPHYGDFRISIIWSKKF